MSYLSLEHIQIRSDSIEHHSYYVIAKFSNKIRTRFMDVETMNSII